MQISHIICPNSFPKVEHARLLLLLWSLTTLACGSSHHHKEGTTLKGEPRGKHGQWAWAGYSAPNIHTETLFMDILTPKVSRIETFCNFLLSIFTFPGNLLITYNIPPKFTNNSFYSNHRNYDVFPLLQKNRFLLCKIPPIQHSWPVIPCWVKCNFYYLWHGNFPEFHFSSNKAAILRLLTPQNLELCSCLFLFL